MTCIYCLNEANTIDHIIPRSYNGGDEPSNLVPACKSCNSAKGNRPLEYFLRNAPEVLKRVRAYQSKTISLKDIPPNAPIVQRKDKDTRRGYTFNMNKDNLLALKKTAFKEGITIHEIFCQALEAWLAKNGTEFHFKRINDNH